jgi:hypothetical protein
VIKPRSAGDFYVPLGDIDRHIGHLPRRFWPIDPRGRGLDAQPLAVSEMQLKMAGVCRMNWPLPDIIRRQLPSSITWR